MNQIESLFWLAAGYVLASGPPLPPSTIPQSTAIEWLIDGVVEELAASRSSLVPRLLVDGIDPLHLFVSFVIPQTKFSSSQPTTNGALSSIVDEFIGVVAGSVLSFFAERCGWLPPLTHSKREEPTTPFIHQHSASAPAFNSFISFSINQLHED